MKRKYIQTIYIYYFFGIIAQFAICQVQSQCTFTVTSGYCINVERKFLHAHHSPYIEDLYIVNSDLSLFNPRDFSSLRNLRILHVDNCTLPKGEENLWSHLKSLEELQLTNLYLVGNVNTMFKNNSSLKTLSLQYVELDYITKDIFKQLIFIENIDLSNNMISQIEVGAFENLPLLKKVDMAYNKLGVHFSPFYLSLPSGGCDVCGEECSQYAIDQCDVNKNIDLLWRQFENNTNIFNFKGNPLCSVLPDKIFETYVPNEESYSSSSFSGECTEHELSSCENHQKRLKFLSRACNQEEINRKKRKESETNQEAENDDESYEDMEDKNSVQSTTQSSNLWWESESTTSENEEETTVYPIPNYSANIPTDIYDDRYSDNTPISPNYEDLDELYGSVDEEDPNNPTDSEETDEFDNPPSSVDVEESYYLQSSEEEEDPDIYSSVETEGPYIQEEDPYSSVEVEEWLPGDPDFDNQQDESTSTTNWFEERDEDTTTLESNEYEDETAYPDETYPDTNEEPLSSVEVEDWTEDTFFSKLILLLSAGAIAIIAGIMGAVIAGVRIRKRFTKNKQHNTGLTASTYQVLPSAFYCDDEYDAMNIHNEEVNCKNSDEKTLDTDKKALETVSVHNIKSSHESSSSSVDSSSAERRDVISFIISPHSSMNLKK